MFAVDDPDPWLARARALDVADPLARMRDRFLPADDLVAYLDGNSLGRPLRATAEHLDAFVRERWGGRLIRGWTDGWLGWPEVVGDRLGRVALGAGPGQVVVADSTSVLLYKLLRAAVAADPHRDRIVADRGDFPTDRWLVDGIAGECGMQVRWIDTDPAAGVTAGLVADAVDRRTALVIGSLVSYRSAWLADAEAITRIAHDAGALVLWDVSHAVGAVELALDAWHVDLAVGCTYKYLNAGPGSPAFAYVAREVQPRIRQPIQGWIGHRDPFAMGPGYEPAAGPRGLLSGTPPILAMVPLRSGLDLLEEAGMPAVRAKSVALTTYAVEVADAWLTGYGVEVASPRDPARRGGHVTLRVPDARRVVDRLWGAGVLPDHRAPDGIRLGLAPLSTSFDEVHRGLRALRDAVADGGGSDERADMRG